MKKLLLLMALIISLASCSDSAERKLEKIRKIDNKYRETKFYNAGNIDEAKKKIYKFLSQLQVLKGQEVVPNIDKTTDSLWLLVLQRNDIDLEQYKKDTAAINKIVPNYFDGWFGEKQATKDIAVAFSNDLDRTYDDIIFYIENGRFENGVNQEELDRRLSEPRRPSDKDIEKWMSGWDGSIKDFVNKIKKNLDDPDSFKHVETAANNKGSIVRVRMKFRCKNMYDATVSHTAVAVLNVADGTVSEIELLD